MMAIHTEHDTQGSVMEKKVLLQMWKCPVFFKVEVLREPCFLERHVLCETLQQFEYNSQIC